MLPSFWRDFITKHRLTRSLMSWDLPERQRRRQKGGGELWNPRSPAPIVFLPSCASLQANPVCVFMCSPFNHWNDSQIEEWVKFYPSHHVVYVMSRCVTLVYLQFPLWPQPLYIEEIEERAWREMTPTSGVGLNEGRFTLSIAASSYLNPKRVCWAGLWDKCYCLLSEVVHVSN